ncbi:hypothetical protein C2E15_04485 [Mixta gaviniae]|uniref:Uncharacterized protein n=1 Tax=Mixta gaviniae TaxID=665914 RepID=A0A1X1E6J1_9GAMM|nr:hypothetical protein C2E15_04485 [Mixta gaviniae]ORM84482.1 hypothetical protein HA44_04915 [Mixta gaviniae]
MITGSPGAGNTASAQRQSHVLIYQHPWIEQEPATDHNAAVQDDAAYRSSMQSDRAACRSLCADLLNIKARTI